MCTHHYTRFSLSLNQAVSFVVCNNQHFMFYSCAGYLHALTYLLCGCCLLSGLPSSPPNITAVAPLSNTSFTVNWTIPDPSYNYTVIWTNLNTSVVDNFTVSGNTNSYTVTGLSEYDNYNVSVAIVGLCGMMTSGSITVYG